MGVPSFFAWLARKFPKVLIDCVKPDRVVDASGHTVPGAPSEPPNRPYDNLYLDMNGSREQ